MPPRPQRLVRRRPLSERIQALLNPLDLWLWMSEEIQTLDWDSKAFGTRFGLAANFLFLLARANAGGNDAVDDVFSDAPSSGWVAYLVNFVIWTLIPISCLNAFYTLTRTRQYRLFEANVEAAGPATPSAHRVRVDSSPTGSTPLRLLQEVLRPESAEQRAHPDKTRDVWEINVWDPYPATLRMFCLFGPGHVLIHMLFLPLLPLDPRPSVTVFKCLVLQAIFSATLLVLHSRFSQQIKDTAIVQKEVMHEYDTKYVHPRLHPVVREAGTQVSIVDDTVEHEAVTIGTPTTLIRRGFQTRPNPNYAKHIDPDAGQQPTYQPRTSVTPFSPSPASSSIAVESPLQVQLQRQHQQQLQRHTNKLRQSLPAPSVSSLINQTYPSTVSTGTDAETPQQQRFRSPTPHQPPAPTPLRNTAAAPPTAVASSGIGGSMGVYQHIKSPLKKATSLGDIGQYGSPRNSREMAAREQADLANRMVRQSSPLKGQLATENRRATSGAAMDPSSYMHSPTMLANARATRWTQERFPSRRL